MRERLARFHPDAPETAVIPGGVDASRFTPEARPPPDALGSHDISFLTVRRLTPRMGLETLVEAFADVTRSHPGAHLYVGGDGPRREALETRAATLGIQSSVTFLGYVPDADLAATYAAADVFVLPTIEFEGFGLVTLEALAAETPVVGTRAGATPELLGELERSAAVPEQLLVPPGDADALASAMAAWAGVSDAQAAEAGSACRSHVFDSGYTWERVTDRIEALFERVRA
jgi:glycosyltransferase involved in cell wall biosynthesis